MDPVATTAELATRCWARMARNLETLRRRGAGPLTLSDKLLLGHLDDPEAALRAAARGLAPGGTLHVVDFGDMADLPGWLRRALTAWLARFHVRYRPETDKTLAALAAGDGVLANVQLFGGYATLSRLARHQPIDPAGLPLRAGRG